VITIVSGLPRSGTSLMMQMLAAGGMQLLADHERKADTDNPRGYWEWEPAKLLPQKPELIDAAEGKAVKVISQLLPFLPEGRDYKVLFMERPLTEVLASQKEMLRRRGTVDSAKDDVMAELFTKHLREVREKISFRMAVLFVPYPKLIGEPMSVADAVGNFLGIELDVEGMAAQVDAGLYRNRG
jgi:hypothetical protein